MKKNKNIISMIGIIFSIVLVLSFYGGTNFYIAKRLYQGIILLFSDINIWVYAVVYIFIALSIIIGFAPHSFRIKKIMNIIASFWLGIYVYLLIFFLIADIMILFGRVARIIQSPMPLTTRFWSALIVILLTIVIMIYGKFKATQIKYISYDIKLKDFVLSDKIKIVMIADLHLGASDCEKNLPKIIRDINCLEPDIVCMVGDIFSDDINLIRNPAIVMDLFRSIRATHGVYACLGNHDGGLTFNEMLTFLKQSNINLLNDEHIVIDGQLVLIGRLDARPIFGFDGFERTGIADVMASVNSRLPIVVMDHNPSHIDEYGNKFDLLLFGHTHKGQMFPLNLITNTVHNVNHGYYQKDIGSPHIIVTSGVSTWGPPIRIGTYNEIVSITLR